MGLALRCVVVPVWGHGLLARFGLCSQSPDKVNTQHLPVCPIPARHSFPRDREEVQQCPVFYLEITIFLLFFLAVSTWVQAGTAGAPAASLAGRRDTHPDGEPLSTGGSPPPRF